jgi:predicted HicB family RNase H-like nuclease
VARSERIPSGRILVRVPVDLHKALVKEAELQKVPMNQFIGNVLAAAVGYRRPTEDK